MAVTFKFYDRETGITYTEENVPPEKLEKMKERWFTSLAKMVSGPIRAVEEKAGGKAS